MIRTVELMQQEIATLCSLDKRDEALKLLEKYCFSLFLRVYAVELIRTRSSRQSPGEKAVATKNQVFRCDPNDYATCLELVALTHPKNISFEKDMLVQYVEIPKKDSTKVRVLGISNIVDRVLQTQFLVLLDPIIEAQLPEGFYGFRKGRSTLQALGFLTTSIQLSDLSRYHLVSVDMSKCFDSISHQYILENYPFPQKFKALMER